MVNKTLCEYAITNEKTKDIISGKAHHSDVPSDCRKSHVSAEAETWL